MVFCIFSFLIHVRLLEFILDLRFQVILITSVKNNSLRLSAVKQLVPLIEVNNELLLSRILKIAIRSLILDHSVYVRENILITLGKIVLLYQPHTYVAIFEENFENISSRVLVSLSFFLIMGFLSVLHLLSQRSRLKKL